MSTFTKSITDTLVLHDSSSIIYTRVKAPGVADYLTIGQSVRYELIPSPLNKTVVDTVTVAETRNPGRTKGRPDAVTVSETVTMLLNRHKSVTDTLGINQFVVAFLVPVGVTPYNVIDPIAITYANSLTTPTSVTLVFGATTVTLRKPDFGDSNSYEAFRIQRASRGGDLQIFQDPIWPTTEVLDFKFSQLDDPSDLITFLTASLGGQIDLHDQFGRHWKGFILTPEGQIIQPKRKTFTAAFRFQGVLQDS